MTKARPQKMPPTDTGKQQSSCQVCSDIVITPLTTNPPDISLLQNFVVVVVVKEALEIKSFSIWSTWYFSSTDESGIVIPTFITAACIQNENLL